MILLRCHDAVGGSALQVGPQARELRREGEKSSKASSATKGDEPKRKTEYLVRVHFDGFTAKWDESYGEQEWREKKLLPLFTKVYTDSCVSQLPCCW